MIDAVLFDLDGTLVQTEKLKALSYARAAHALSDGAVTEEEVMEAFKEVVGFSRHEVAVFLVERFNLEKPAERLMKDTGTETPWQAYVHKRLEFYEAILADPDILRESVCPYNVGLLTFLNNKGTLTGLATMSFRDQARKVLDILGLGNRFGFVATRDDVEHGKPDPEIYRLVARHLEADPKNCLVIEDSATGVRAALAAGMRCIAVTTDFTRQQVHDEKLLDPNWVVDDPSRLHETAARAMAMEDLN